MLGSSSVLLCRGSALVLGLIVVAGGCGEDDSRPKARSSASAGPATISCGLPEAEDRADPELVPDAFLLDEPKVEVAQTFDRRRRVVATLNVRASVQDSFKAYKAAIPDSPFELLQIDNEGFEAELYLQRGKEFAVIQIRSSKCDDASLVILNLPST